jgi:hypothetical protein
VSKTKDKRIYLKGALDSAQILRMRGINYLTFRCSRETQHISDKEISIIYKNISSMHND